MIDDDSDGFPEGLPDDGGQTTFETEYTGRPPSIAVVEAIAAIEGVSSNDVEFTLYESLDPEALDILFDESADMTERETNIVAEFHISDYTVEVASNGELTVTARGETE